MPPRRILVVSSSGADWCHLRWPLAAMRAHPGLEPILVATAAMLVPEYGRAAEVAAADGFEPDETVDCLLASDTDAAMGRTLGLATVGFADLLDRRRPDAVLVMADRHEMLAPATAALAMRIPVVHVEGGEASEGVIDHAVRNALSMLASHHLVTTSGAAARLAVMGEAPWRIHRVGAGSLDHLRHGGLPAAAEILADLGLDPAVPPLVLAYHPLTLDESPAAGLDAVLDALDAIDPADLPVVVLHPNADAGAAAITRRLRAWTAARAHAVFVTNLEPKRYWGLLRGSAALAGNSSSGVMESASADVPAVDIGPRQAGREAPDSVERVPADAAAVEAAIRAAITPAGRARAVAAANPYGDGRAGERIAGVLATADLETTVLRKSAIPIPAPPEGSDGLSTWPFVEPA